MRAARARPAARLVVVVGCLLAFALLARQLLHEGPLTHVDRAVMLWMADHRVAWVTQAMLLVSEVHRTAGVLLATALLAAWFAWRRHWPSVLALLVVPTGMLLNVGLKHLFLRQRPVLDEPLVLLSTFSFPSGHGVASTVFYGALGALVIFHRRAPALRGAAVAACVAMVALVCASRVYLGAHYLSDVLAAVCVGAAWLTIWLSLAFRRASSPAGTAASPSLPPAPGW